MTQHIELKHGQILHAGFTAPIQELLSAAVVNFRLVRVNSSTVAVPASAGAGQVGIAVGGKYRWRSSEITAALPGGLPNGEHPIFVTASDNDFGGPTEDPDKTVHTFGLEVKKAGETPSTALYREVGKVTIAAAAIAGIRQTVASASGAQIENGALSSSGDLAWTRDESGAWVPQLKENSVGSAEIAADAVGSSEIAAGAVGESELATDSVAPAKIAPQTLQSTTITTGVLGSGGSSQLKWTFPVAFTETPDVVATLQRFDGGTDAVHGWLHEVATTYATYMVVNNSASATTFNVHLLATRGL